MLGGSDRSVGEGRVVGFVIFLGYKFFVLSFVWLRNRN